MPLEFDKHQIPIMSRKSSMASLEDTGKKQRGKSMMVKRQQFSLVKEIK